MVWTRRKTLSFLMQIYDPLQILTPVLLEGKLLARRLASPPLQWDEDVPAQEKIGWAEWLQQLLDDGRLSFQRSVTPPGTVGSPTVVGYADASLVACAVAIYVVWELAFSTTESGHKDRPNFSSKLLVAKGRTAPLFGTIIPREEMQAVCMLLRLQLQVLRYTSLQPGSVVSATDSRCAVAALSKRGSLMKPFFANRAAEVKWG